MKARNSKTAGPSLRDKLGENFLRAIQSDFEANGAAVIEQLRLKSPEKYVEIAARLIARIEPSRGGCSGANVGAQGISAGYCYCRSVSMNSTLPRK